MTGPVLVDSDVLIEVLRGRNHEISARWIELREGEAPIVYSPVTSAEVWRGVRASEAAAVAAAFSALTCIPIDAGIGKRAGEYLARFHASHGTEIGDAFIAATSSVHELRLWTRNRKHFPMRDIDYF
jgi:predicted nucleic acid-binding protein